MELGTASILVQLLLIFVLVAVFAGRRHLKARRDRRCQPPGSIPASTTLVPVVRASQPPALVLTDLPPIEQRAMWQEAAAVSRVSEELLPPCFADTCADWAQVEAATGQAPLTRFGLADWSAPTDRVALEDAPVLQDLAWAADVPAPLLRSTPRTPRTAAGRPVASTMSCTISPQAYPLA